MFEEPEDPTNRSFFSEIISSISDVKLSNSGRYMISRDYLSVKVWDLHMETKPIECYPVRIIFYYKQIKYLGSQKKMFCFNCRFMNTYDQSCVLFMKTIAFLINLNVAGMGTTRPL